MKEQSFLSRIFRTKNRPEPTLSSASVNRSRHESAEETAIKSQNKQILNYLSRGQSLTQIEAAELFGVWRLGARIWDLRRKGHDITTFTVTAGNKRFAKYQLNISKN